MKKICLQFVRFIGISGIGWVIDFSLYLVFTSAFHWEVFYSNCLSALPAVTLVFCVSTSKIFQKAKRRITIRQKYIIYVCYQVILLLAVSVVGQRLAGWVAQICADISIIVQCSKIIAKLLITPVTMAANFAVMKMLTEKI